MAAMFLFWGVVVVLFDGACWSAERETVQFCGVYRGCVVDSEIITNPSPFSRERLRRFQRVSGLSTEGDSE